MENIKKDFPKAMDVRKMFSEPVDVTNHLVRIKERILSAQKDGDRKISCDVHPWTTKEVDAVRKFLEEKQYHTWTHEVMGSSLLYIEWK